MVFNENDEQTKNMDAIEDTNTTQNHENEESEEKIVKIMKMGVVLTQDFTDDVIQPNRNYEVYVSAKVINATIISYQVRVMRGDAEQNDEPLENSETRHFYGKY
jgi:hypothetical protein